MDGFDGFLVVLLGIGVMAIPFVLVAALVLSIRNRNRLRLLDQRFGVLERQFAALGPTTVPPATAPTSAALGPAVPEVEQAPEFGPKTEPSPPPISSAPLEATADPADSAASPSASTQPPTAAAARMSLEERLGTQWAVWVGGLALALGGILSGALFDRGRVARPSRAGDFRRPAGAGARRRRRVGTLFLACG